MGIRPVSRLLGRAGRALSVPLLILAAATPAHADYDRAFALYQAGRFDEARMEFLQLAALGDHAAQMNLAVMARNGEAGPPDNGAAVGWVVAAVQNGSDRFQRAQAEKLLAELPPAARASADAVIARYGRAALERDVLPDVAGENRCGAEPGRPTHAASPVYPVEARRTGRDGVVLVEFTIGVDGLARDVAVIQSLPPMFAKPTVRAVYDSRYAPAQRDGAPVEVRSRMRWTYTLVEGGVLWNTEAFGKFRRAADAGLPAAQYLVGAIAALDPTVGLSREQGARLVLEAAKGGHPAAQLDVGRQFLVGAGCSEPQKARAWLEPAAREGNPVAAVLLVPLTLSSGADVSVDQLRGWLANAARSEDEYALKHAIPWLAGLGPPELADTALALTAAERLDEHGLGLDPQALEARALALAANGRHPAAARLQEDAIARARKLSWNVAAMEERLAEYSAGRAWRGDPYLLPPQTSVAPPRAKAAERVCTAATPLDCPAGRTRPDQPPDRKPPLGSRLPDP
jgi:TonB family protein